MACMQAFIVAKNKTIPPKNKLVFIGNKKKIQTEPN